MSSNRPTTSTGSPAPPLRSQNDKKVYKCDLCSKVFKSKRVLAKHITPSHIRFWSTIARVASPERYEFGHVLHPESCTECPYDLIRMKRMVKNDPSLLFNSPHPVYGINQNLNKFVQETSPLWHAYASAHLTCFKFILEASKPENINHTQSRTPLPTFCQLIDKQILADFLRDGRHDENTTCEMLEALLEHGVSPNLEIPVTKMPPACEVKQVLIEKCQAKTLIFPSPALHTAITRNSPKILELFLRHGAYPDPVMLTESGDVLPLYSTLGKHVNPIPRFKSKHLIEPCHVILKIVRTDFISTQYSVRGVRQVQRDNRWEPSWSDGGPFNKGRQIKIDLLKTLVAHGASLCPYQVKKGEKIMARETVFSDSLLDSYRWSYREDELMELLKVYLEYGGTSWSKSSFMASAATVCQVFNPAHALDEEEQLARVVNQRYNERSRLIERELDNMLSVMPSLQHACRVAIRKAMVYPCARNVDCLPLPNKIINYIKFETGLAT